MNLQDNLLLSSVYSDNNIVFHTKILVLDKNEKPIRTIQGDVQPGSSISIQSSSAMRRSCSLTFLAREDENDLKNIDHLLSTNKKIKILIGIERMVDYANDILYFSKKNYPFNEKTYPNCGFPTFGQIGKIYVNREDLTYWIWENDKYKQINSIYDYQTYIVWFPMGVYVITNPSISHSTSGCTISLSCNDKMCLLDGSLGGTLPAEVDFGKYYQMVGKMYIDGEPNSSLVPNPNDYTIYIDTNTNNEYIWIEMNGFKLNDGTISLTEPLQVTQYIYDIIRTAVINYGHENPSKVIINDIPLMTKQIHRNSKGDIIWYKDGVYTLEEPEDISGWKQIGLNEDVGYIYIKFIPPDLDEMVANAGESITSILDKIKNKFGNYEYFYDIEGNFVFQEIKNYLNTSYESTEAQKGVSKFYLENVNKDEIEMEQNNLKILDVDNYSVDYYGGQKSVFTFEENTGLITSYNNSLDYKNLKNDYHIWSKGDKEQAVTFHYHLVIKEKPQVFQTRKVVLYDKKDYEGKQQSDIKPEDIGIRLALNNDDPNEIINYTPNDWRAELYLQGLEATQYGSRPDIYQQELLDKFNIIYIWGDLPSKLDKNPNSRFSTEDAIVYIVYDLEDDPENPGQKKIIEDGIEELNYEPTEVELNDYRVYIGSTIKKSGTFNPNGLTYFIDYLEPVDKFYGLSVDDIGTRLIAKTEDNIVKMYNDEMPNYLLINEEWEKEYKEKLIKMGQENHLEAVEITNELYEKLAPNVWGYSAEEKVRDYLYQNTHYAESITLQCVPIYALDVNQRITVRDSKTGINGDYIISQITMPLSQGSNMSITATKANDRI